MDFSDEIVFAGGINTDDDPRSVPKGDYRDFSYCRLGNVSGTGFSVVTSWGTYQVPNGGIYPQDKVLGATFWEKQNAIVFFVFRADGDHQIKVYYISTGTVVNAVTSSALNFSLEWPVYHANVIDDILKWTDGRWDEQMYTSDGGRLFNPPYQINLQKALDGYYTTIDLRTIDAIKWPLDPPRVSYFTDTTRQDNKLRNKLFKFIIQPIYENGEVGVWSMYSNLDLPEQSELVSGTNWVYLNNSNGINIQFFTGPKIIRKFNIAVQQFDKDNFGAEAPFGVFLQLDKTQDNIADNIYHTVNFYGGASESPAIDVVKNYDRLPIVANCQEYLPTSELTYVNFREGYNKPTESYEILNVQVSYDLNEIQWTALDKQSASIVKTNAGWLPSTPPIVLYCTNAWFAEQWAQQFCFSATQIFSVTIGILGTWSYQLSQSEITAATAISTFEGQNAYILNILGNSWAAFYGLTPGSVMFDDIGGQVYMYYGTSSIPSIPTNTTFTGSTGLRQTNVQPSLKVGATHEFGIVYGDRAYRDSTVYTVDSMNLFVPWFYDIDRSGLSNPDNPFTVTPNFTINHVPPVWADRYWIVAKPATEVLSFGQYTTNADDNPLGGTGYVSSIKLDEVTRNRYIIQIDKYYVTQNIGASIRHQIKVGDKIRFIRKRAEAVAASASDISYLPYIELDVIGYDPAGGEEGRQLVYTNVFDIRLIEPDLNGAAAGQVFGQLIEIYTPRPSTDDTGNIFVSTWKDVSEAIEIRNPHRTNRAHGAPPKYYLTVGIPPGGFSTAIYIYGDYSFLNGTNQDITIHYDDGHTDFPVGVTVTSALYRSGSNRTILTLSGITPNSSMSYITIDSQYQTVNNLESIVPASFQIQYGDVYVRQRNYQTGLDRPYDVYYYYIEDPNYSDYWSSDVHNTGRLRVEDQNAKMSHRKAVAIHSDSYIVGTQINGLSSFALDNTNIEEMNSLYGGVVRAYMSGREGKTLKCLQPKKENSIYIQFYPNEVGSDSTVRVSGKTFASWFDYRSLYGCTNAGATALLPNGNTMYFDNNSGVFVLSETNGQSVVSEIDPDSGKDFKFRTKTKQLAKKYNADPLAVVRTYVNETMGEVGFAFRFGGLQGVGETAYQIGRPDPLDARMWTIQGDATNILNTTIRIYEENGQVTYGTVTKAIFLFGFTYVQVNDNGPTTTGVAMTWYSDYNVEYDHVVFDYINSRWRSTYDYSFSQFAHFGQALIGWNDVNQMFIHNQQGSITFHDQPFIQKISFVSNENPAYLKRYQDFTQRANKTFSVTATSTPNQSYPKGMYTQVPSTVVNVYEGYSRGYYRKNLYDPRFYSTGTTTTSVYSPGLTNGWVIPGDYHTLQDSQTNIIIVQGNTNFIGKVISSTYDDILDQTTITLSTEGPNDDGLTGFWYKADLAMLNGEDIRAYAVTHDLTYDPSIDGEGSVLSTIGITGVLS